MSAAHNGTADPGALLACAQVALRDEFDEQDPLAQTALHLIMCAAGAVTALRAADVDAAREALGHARAAVTAATYAVLRVHDEARIGQT